MYNELDRNKYIDYIARLFSIAMDSKIHPIVICDRLAKSDLIKDIENNKYDLVTNNSVLALYNHIFPFRMVYEDALMRYDLGYWCGYVYINLFYEFHKPLSYIFLKLPLKDLISMYDVYHEMDISSIYIEFKKRESLHTILELLLKKNDMKAMELARKTNIPIRTINHLKTSDLNLYNATYKNIQRIVLVLDEPNNLFLETVPISLYNY